MKICICNNVSDRDIREAIDQGARSLRDLRETLCVGNQCGKCACAARQLIRSHRYEALDLATDAAAA